MLVPEDGGVPEIVQVRREEMVGDGSSFRRKLLNEPDADFGVHEGDMITVGFAKHQDGCYLVWKNGTGVKDGLSEPGHSGKR